MITTNIAGDIEVTESTLAFDMPVRVHASAEILLDEFDATVYLGAKYTVTTTNESGQIEINELMLIQDGTTAFVRNTATLNNIEANTYVSVFRAELLRGVVRLFVTGVGNRNKTQFFKIMFKKS